MREVKIGAERDLDGIYGQLSLHAELTFKVSCGNAVRSLEDEYIYFIFT